MLKPLREEQADMKARWSDPAYRWANDSNLRRQFHAERQPTFHQGTQDTGCEVEPSLSKEIREGKEGEPK
jgi:hypothetical protein